MKYSVSLFDLTSHAHHTKPHLFKIQISLATKNGICLPTDRQQDIVNESGYTGLTRNCNQIINCAMLLSLGYIREATTYAESCGGGGSLGSGWGRDKDEDDEHCWRRCIAVSAAMMRPVKYRIRRSR